MEATEATDLYFAKEIEKTAVVQVRAMWNISKNIHMTKGMKYERDRPKRLLQCQKSPQELGFDLDPHKGIVERNLKKPTKKPYVSQLEKTDSRASPNRSGCCVLRRTLSGVLVSVGISSFTWCMFRQRHSLNYPWPPVFFLTTFSQPWT